MALLRTKWIRCKRASAVLALLLALACSDEQLPADPPGPARYNDAPIAAWMPGCYEFDHDEGRFSSKDVTAFELRARPFRIVEGQQHYAVYVAGHPIRYAEWWPLLGSALRITVTTHPGSGFTLFTLWRSAGTVKGTYQEMGDMPSEPIRYALKIRKVMCEPAPN